MTGMNERFQSELTIFDGVDNGAESIPNGILGLRQGVFVRPFDQDGHTAWIATVLHKRKLFLALQCSTIKQGLT